MTESNRRSFLRVAIENAVKEAQKIAASSVGVSPPSAARPSRVVEPVRPPLPERRGTVHELLRRLPEVGLGTRAADVRRLARASVRFEPAPRDEVPATSWVAEGGDWLAALDLAELAQHGLAVPPGDEAALLVRDDMLEVAPPPGPPEGARGVRMAGELVLPRVWSAPVQALELSVVEIEAWTKLRRWWADEQGSLLEDEDPIEGPLHRVGGYPDERSGLMPLMCELDARNIESPGADVHDAARAAGIEPAQLDWRLAVELSADSGMTWRWGKSTARLYLWLREGDLEQARFAGMQAIAR